MTFPAGPNTGIIRVLVADSNETQSQVLSSALRRQGTFKVIRCEAELSKCFSLLGENPADVVLLSSVLMHQRQSLYELVRGLHSAYPKIAIVLLLDNYDRELVVNALRAGARGLFYLASLPFKQLCRCIISVYQGQFWVNMEQIRFLIDALTLGTPAHLLNSIGKTLLSPREEQTVNLVAEGLSNREIASELAVKENTVKKSLLRIYEKLGVSNRVELVLYALAHREQRVASPDRASDFPPPLVKAG